MATTTEREREILHEHPHEQELVHHAPARTGVPTSMAIVLFTVAAAGIALLVTIIVLAGSGPSASSPTPAMGPGAMSGTPAAAASGAAGTATRVDVRLGEMYVRPSTSTVPAGKVTFAARNYGMLPHELMVERMPIKLDAPSEPNEEAAMGMIEEMGHMGSGRMTLSLKPGRYELFCNVAGHYAAGQHTVLTVTG